LVARVAEDEVKAFVNSCLHRGTQLRPSDSVGNVMQFRCPFHGFTWNLDGTLKEIPCRWDFPHLKDQDMKLPQAQVARWQGYIFVRENAGGPSIEEYLQPLPKHHPRWAHDECVTGIWAGKIIDANWKAVSEAFM